MSLQLQYRRLAATPGGVKLHLGCGANLLEGWLNTDNVPSPFNDYLDFARRFPLGNNCLGAVFCEHSIEHVSRNEARQMILEIFRTLRPGGALRIVTPSLDNLCRMAVNPESEISEAYLAWFKTHTSNPKATIADAVNLCFYGHGHRHIYSAAQLRALLADAGFEDLSLMPAGTTAHPVFHGADRHGKIIGEAINAIEAIAIEAVKPSDPT